jgi:hypothetical protein
MALEDARAGSDDRRGEAPVHLEVEELTHESVGSMTVR